MAGRRQTATCSFCGKGREDVRRLIAGPDVFICDACVTLCNEIIAEGGGQDPPGSAARRDARRHERRGRHGGGWWRRFLPGWHRVLGSAPAP